MWPFARPPLAIAARAGASIADARAGPQAMRGPLVVVVDARAWSDYAGGVFAGGNATHPALDHLVQLVTAPPLGHVHAPRPTTRASRPPRSRS